MVYFLSPTIYNNPRVNIPSLFYTQGLLYLENSVDISGAFVQYPNLSINHFELDNLYQNPINIYWSKQDDPIVDRFHISITDQRSDLSQQPSVVISLRCKDDIAQTYVHTNPGSSSIPLPASFFKEDSITTSIYKPYFNLTIGENSISILFTKIDPHASTSLDNPTRSFYFYHVGYLEPNTQAQYYSSPVTNTCYLIASKSFEGGIATPSQNSTFIRHYCNQISKYVHAGTQANYPIICQSGQNPISKWLTDFVLYDNNPTLDYPYIGIVRDLICSVGNYPLGKPVSYQGNFWLPVFKFLNKTVMFRCFVPN